MEGKQLAQRAYFALIEETFELQRQLVLAKTMSREFGTKALPPSKIMRSYMSVFGRAPQRMLDFERSTMEQLAQNYEALAHMEEVFEKASEADMEDFARAVKDNFGRRGK